MFVDDVEEQWDALLDPPCVISNAVKRSVRRWRNNNVCILLPSVAPPPSDLPSPPLCSLLEHERSIVIDFASISGQMVGGRVRTIDSVPQWLPSHAADLASAMAGGQWPQARRAAIRSWGGSNDCQLCKEQIGTLSHRFTCASTCPEDGWPRAPPQATFAMNKWSHARRAVLQTHALAFVRIPRPLRNIFGNFRWIFRLIAPDPALTFYTDGSVFEGRWRDLQSVGFSIVAVGESGRLARYGMGVPPAWVDSSAAAEAWAVFVA